MLNETFSVIFKHRDLAAMAREKKGNHHRRSPPIFFLVSFLSEFSFNDECEWIGVDETIYQTFLKWKRLKRKISINEEPARRFFMRFSCSARLSISNFGVVFLIKIYKRNIEKKKKPNQGQNQHFLTNVLYTTHYSKSQIFVQKFNFDKTPSFHEFFTHNFFDNFSRESKVVNT